LDGDRRRFSRGKTTGTRIIPVPRGQFAGSASASRENSGNRDVPGASVARTAGTYFCHLAAIDPGVGIDGGGRQGSCPAPGRPRVRWQRLFPAPARPPVTGQRSLPHAGQVSASWQRSLPGPGSMSGCLRLAPRLAPWTGISRCGRSPNSLTCFKYSRRRRGPTTDVLMGFTTGRQPSGDGSRSLRTQARAGRRRRSARLAARLFGRDYQG
jgi:hypothetical protein